MATEYEILNSAPGYCTSVADLAEWSQNFGTPTPFALFLDIIGWSEENMGEPMFSGSISEKFGYLEISKLAAALSEYANCPIDVGGWVETLMNADIN